MKKSPVLLSQKEHEQILFSDELFPIRVLWNITPENRYPNYDPTWHEQLEILYFTEGSAICECNFRRFLCRAGDIVVINPCEMHVVDPHSGEAKYHCIMIDHSLYSSDGICEVKYIEPVLRGRVRFNNLISDNEYIKKIICELLDECKNLDTGYEMAVKGNCLRLLAALFKSELSDTVRNISGNTQSITPALAYIAAHYTEDIPLSRLASECCMSVSYFCRLFRDITGQTAISYINEYRLTKAKALLLTTKCSISEIAMQTGFPDSSYFTRRFKALFGIPPAKLRQNV